MNNTTFSHTHTVSTLALKPGDVVFELGGRVVSSVERDASNLSACLIRFVDGTFFHAGSYDAHAISRN